MLRRTTVHTTTVFHVSITTTTLTTKPIYQFLFFFFGVYMRSISLTLSDIPITIDSDVLVEVSHIKKEPLMKIYLFCSASEMNIVYRDSEKMIVKVDTKPETTFLVMKKYIIEVREELIRIYILKNSEFNDIGKLKIDIDVEYEERDDDYDTYYYLKIVE